MVQGSRDTGSFRPIKYVSEGREYAAETGPELFPGTGLSAREISGSL